MSTPTRPSASASVINASPRTPQRAISSTFSSPGFRPEEDTVILEIGTRYLCAGLANDSTPRCKLGYGPEQSCRLGDYRKWLPGYENRTRQVKTLEAWSKDYELWQLDIRNFDLGLMEDKIERAIRTAFSEYLLLDAKGRKVVLVVPALTSHNVLSKILKVLFYNLQISSITLVPPPTMVVVAAGQRSGLVVNIGWHETTITAVYEFREVMEVRSTRAMKRLLEEVALLLDGLIMKRYASLREEKSTDLDFQYVEELTTQLIWCRPTSEWSAEEDTQSSISIRLPLPSSKAMGVSFTELSQPVEKALLAKATEFREQDDQEHALNHLLYDALLRLPADVRTTCVPRIIFTGGGSNIPGLKSRLLSDLELTVKQRGWSHVWRARDVQAGSRLLSAQTVPSIIKSGTATDQLHTGPAFEDQVHDAYKEKLLLAAAKSSKAQIHNEIRGLESMGAFAGASLTAALHIKSLVEIEREVFLQHGLSGPKREQESSSSRTKSLGGNLAKPPTSDSSTWTLGAWA